MAEENGPATLEDLRLTLTELEDLADVLSSAGMTQRTMDVVAMAFIPLYQGYSDAICSRQVREFNDRFSSQQPPPEEETEQAWRFAVPPEKQR